MNVQFLAPAGDLEITIQIESDPCHLDTPQASTSESTLFFGISRVTPSSGALAPRLPRTPETQRIRFAREARGALRFPV